MAASYLNVKTEILDFGLGRNESIRRQTPHYHARPHICPGYCLLEENLIVVPISFIKFAAGEPILNVTLREGRMVFCKGFDPETALDSALALMEHLAGP